MRLLPPYDTYLDQRDRLTLLPDKALHTRVWTPIGGPGTLPTPRPGGYPGGALVYDATIQFVNPFVLNAVAPTRLLIGTSFLYESTDRGTT